MRCISDSTRENGTCWKVRSQWSLKDTTLQLRHWDCGVTHSHLHMVPCTTSLTRTSRANLVLQPPSPIRQKNTSKIANPSQIIISHANYYPKLSCRASNGLLKPSSSAIASRAQWVSWWSTDNNPEIEAPPTLAWRRTRARHQNCPRLLLSADGDPLSSEAHRTAGRHRCHC